MPNLETQEEKLGYVIAKLDVVADLQKEMNERLRSVEKEISLYKTIIHFVKLIALSFAFLLAFKFGDIRALWSK